MPFSLPDLPYPFNALEPHIDAKTMEIHHDKHHGTYVTKLNAALEKAPSFQGRPIEEILKSLDSIPADVRAAVRNHGGGHLNHSLFWKMLSPKGGGKPSGALATTPSTRASAALTPSRSSSGTRPPTSSEAAGRGCARMRPASS